MLTRYDKSIAAALSNAIVIILFYTLNQYNIKPPLEVQAAAITIVTTFIVWLVPNKSGDTSTP